MFLEWVQLLPLSFHSIQTHFVFYFHFLFTSLGGYSLPASSYGAYQPSYAAAVPAYPSSGSAYSGGLAYAPAAQQIYYGGASYGASPVSYGSVHQLNHFQPTAHTCRQKMLEDRRDCKA